MRVTRLFLVSCASLMFAAQTNAQQGSAPAPTRTVDDYVCAFAGECGKQADTEKSILAPAMRGFRLSVPERRTGANSQATPSATTTNGGRASTGAARGQQVASKRGGRASTRASAMQPRRMDLRVSFLLGSAQLTAQAQEEAKVFAKALTVPELAAKRFRIEGHTDSSGGRAMNLDLSRRRAQAVADYLVGLGVQNDRFEVRGYGPDRPLPRHRPSSPDNRRVEAQLL
jgi:outer membrane protein OmpA-like peptidoglycan-associated protein